jgi:Tfp pilus assembly protein PilN
MIRINLAPQQGKKPRGQKRAGMPALRLPAISGAPSTWRVFALVAWLAGPGAVAGLHVTGTREVAALEESVRVAQDDSARLAAIHLASAALRAREDTIRSKLDIIRGIDHGRYMWAHITDEISRLLPEYVWLTELMYFSNDTPLESPRFALNGRTGSAFALSALMQQLAASPFFTDVTLVHTTRITEGDIRVFSFAVELQYRRPPTDIVDMRPVFSVDSEE